MSAQVELEIVLAHYNGAKFIEQQLQSIRENAASTGLSYRILIFDDRSKSEDYEALKKLVKDQSNVELHRNEVNLGVVKTFAAGLSKTTADYVMLSDQDDVWRQGKIVKSLGLLKSIEQDGPSLVFTDLEPVDTNLLPIRPSMLNLKSFDQSRDRFGLVLRNVVAGCTTIMNRKLLNLAMPFPDGITMHDHWLAICAAFGGSIGFLNERTILYRQHGSNVVGQQQGFLFRLARPVNTFRKLDVTLMEKSRQLGALIERLKHYQFAGDKTALIEIQKSMNERNFKSLLKLQKNGALKTFGSSQIALWPAFLLTSLLKTRDAQ